MKLSSTNNLLKSMDKSDRIYDVQALDPTLLVTPKPVTWDDHLDQPWLRRLLVMMVMLVLWQLTAMWADNSLLLPTPTETAVAWGDALIHGQLLDRIGTSLGVLLVGYVIGVACALILTSLAMTSRLGREFLTTLTAMFNPLPAIALLPLAMLWFGLGMGSLVFVIAHSVVWVVSLNALAGFEGVSPTLKMVGRNYGLRGVTLMAKILFPAAFPSILTGLKVAWAFAWRTLIAAELVFGVSAGSGGLGWFIYENKNLLEIPMVFAGLLSVIVIGLLVETLIFRLIESKTIKRWGMQS